MQATPTCALREVAQVLAHLGRPGGAVEADHVDAERLERGQGGADLQAHQHRAGGLDGDVDQIDRVTPASAIALGSDDGGLGLEQVLAGLDLEGVDAPRIIAAAWVW